MLAASWELFAAVVGVAAVVVGLVWWFPHHSSHAQYAVAAGDRTQTATLQLTQDVPAGTYLSVWTVWRDRTRSWLDDPAVESSIEVPPPIPHAESHSSQLEIAGAGPAETEIADVAFLYDPATDRFEWSDQPGRGHRTILPRITTQGRDPFAFVAGRVFADTRVELCSEYSPTLSPSEERRLIARARIEGVDLLRAWGCPD